ncbi:MAG: DUF4342 domain-containing protein [Thaumarchaeota archaeon]|nr:MAG: DUF4342 domain-containing protein [Nitrososphaerota archaeon]
MSFSKGLKISKHDISKIPMVKCGECKTELPEAARFCPNCGTQIGLEKDVYDVSAGGLVGKVKEIFQDARVKRIIVKDESGKVLLSIPVTWGAAGAVAMITLAPWLAALGVIAGIVTRCKLEVEKSRDI